MYLKHMYNNLKIYQKLGVTVVENILNMVIIKKLI